VVNAQVCWYPAAMALTPLDNPTTLTGIVRDTMVVPSPSCPEVFAPQHLTPLLLVMAQV
jgi:hypothetical protein